MEWTNRVAARFSNSNFKRTLELVSMSRPILNGREVSCLKLVMNWRRPSS